MNEHPPAPKDYQALRALMGDEGDEEALLREAEERALDLLESGQER